MSFCQDVKQEVMKTPLREFHCRNAMVYAILKLSKTFPQEPVVLFQHHIVVPQSGTDKHPAYPGQCPQLLEQFQIVAVVHPQGRTGGRRQTFPVWT